MQTQSMPIRDNRLANLLIEASPVAVVLTNAQGNIERMNHLSETLFGYSESELVGSIFDVLFPMISSRDNASRPPCILSRSDDAVTIMEWEEVGRRKDGTQFPVRIRLHPLMTASGDMLLANVFDLTESESRDSQRVEAERLAAVLEMISGLAHESRNALQRAQACLDLLELDLSDQSELLDLTDRIRSALRSLHCTYEEVKSYAAPITLKLTNVDLSQLFQLTFEELFAECPGAAPRLQMECDDACQSISVDRSRMKQVFRNLLENSIQASVVGTKVVWRCQGKSTLDPHTIAISIRDHGSGLSREASTRMFEPFFTTKQHGTGLGLAVCRRIVEAHGGMIAAANHPEGGVDVQIVLPAVPAQATGRPFKTPSCLERE